jgi:hypothetical protein
LSLADKAALLRTASNFAQELKDAGVPLKFRKEEPSELDRKLLEIANSVEAMQDGRIHVEKINGPFLFRKRATPAEYSAGRAYAIEQGWLVLHESGTFVRFTKSGADLFA